MLLRLGKGWLLYWIIVKHASLLWQNLSWTTNLEVKTDFKHIVYCAYVSIHVFVSLCFDKTNLQILAGDFSQCRTISWFIKRDQRYVICVNPFNPKLIIQILPTIQEEND